MEKDFLKLKLDRPVENSEEDLLGYDKVYAESLKNILDSNKDRNFVIGLFGDYGSGKSSIINFLEKKYPDNESILFVKSSVWGHNSLESLKQIFLDIGKEFKRGEAMQKLKIDLFEEQEEIDKDKLKHNKLLGGRGILIFFLSFLFFMYFVPKEIISLYISGFTGFGSILVLIFLAYFGIDSISKKKKQLPAHLSNFNDIFKKTKNTLQRDGKNELILVVDDLDRIGKIGELIKVFDKLSVFRKLNGSFYIKIIIPFSLTKYKGNKESFNKVQENIEKFVDTFIWVSPPTGLELYKITKKMKDTFLDKQKIEEALKKFVGVFDNPRKYKLFENFVRCQVETKNNFFNVLCKKDNGLVQSFFDKIKEIIFREEKFVFYQLVLFFNPDKVFNIYEEYPAIVYSNIHYKVLNREFEQLVQFNPDKELIIFFRANDINSFFDTLKFIYFKNFGKDVKDFFDYVFSLNLDEEYVFQILKSQFGGFIRKEIQFDEFMQFFDFVYSVSDQNLINRIRKRSFGFLLELMNYWEFAGHYIKYTKKNTFEGLWEEEIMMRKYLKKLFEFSIKVNDNHGAFGRAFILFYNKISRLTAMGDILYDEKESLYEFVLDNLELSFGSNGVFDRFKQDFLDSRGLFDLFYIVYLLRKNNYKIKAGLKSKISHIFNKIDWKKIYLVFVDYFQERSNSFKGDYSYELEGVFEDLLILSSIGQILNKNSVRDMWGPNILDKYKFTSSDKTNKKMVLDWIFENSLHGLFRETDETGVFSHVNLLGLRLSEREISEKIDNLYPSLNFLVNSDKEISKSKDLKK